MSGFFIAIAESAKKLGSENSKLISELKPKTTGKIRRKHIRCKTGNSMLTEFF
jgi:hypothetical protein